MKQIIVEIDDDTSSRLEKVAPARSRQRSDFIRRAILRAIWEAEEQATRDAYARRPDSAAPFFDSAVWESNPTAKSRRSKSR